MFSGQVNSPPLSSSVRFLQHFHHLEKPEIFFSGRRIFFTMKRIFQAEEEISG
jgi:hypothetical protein